MGVNLEIGEGGSCKEASSSIMEMHFKGIRKTL